MKDKVIQITKEDLKKLKPEQKEAVLFKLMRNYSVRLNTMNKWQSILIGLTIAAIISLVTLTSQGYLILSLHSFLIFAIIGIYFWLKHHKAFEEKEKFGNQIRAIEKDMREEIKDKLKKELTYPKQFPIEY